VRSAWAVRFASVRVGNITLTDVEGAVGDGQGTGDTALLGMSFLGRLALSREGDRLRLAPRETARGGADSRPSVTLSESRNGMFATTAQINGVALPFLVDTGATSVSIDMAMADRIGLNYQKGTPMLAHTAAGNVRAWRVKLDTVTVGAITLYNVDGTVLEGPGAGIGLLGMSFLSRVDMRRDGAAMVLIKRF
jgi:aspartyl protease family protein